MNNFYRSRRALLCFATTALLVTLSACGGTDKTASMTSGTKLSASVVAVTPTANVTGLTKLSETRVTRTEYDYVFRVALQNGPVAQNYMTATLTGAGPGVTIVDASASFGLAGANAAVTSTDTITLRQDRTLPFNQAALVWSIQPESAAHAVARLETEGQIPVLDRGPSLAGPDANGNGIRDDIDTYLAKLNLPLPLRLAAEQLARGFQSAVALNSADKALTAPIDERIKNGVSCVWSRFPKVITPGALTAGQMVSTLQKLTANTEARTLSYLKYNGSLNGTVASLPQGDGCEN